MTQPRASLTLHVPSTLDAIRQATEQAESWLAEQHVSFEGMYLASLTIEELVTNCIKYGYDTPDGHTIDMVFSVDEQVLTIEVVDDGNPFNPLDAPKPDISSPIENRRIGGLGLHLLRELSDDASYERRDGTNRLTLSKRMS
jgi:anti-sigma regulatory factor (Ser/Thr protein kinase)